MTTTQATSREARFPSRKVGRFHTGVRDDRRDIFTTVNDETYYDQDSLALQMTEDHGRSRKYWLKALSTGEDA